MTQETFKLLENFSQECIDDLYYGFVKDVNTKEHFGTNEDVKLEGMFLYIYQKKDDFFCFIEKNPEYSFDMDGEEKLLLFKLE